MPRLRFFPVSYDVAGKAVVVAGGGEPALAKLRLLVRSEARLMLVSRYIDGELAAFVNAHRIPHLARDLTLADLTGAALLFVATEDEAQDAALAAVGRQAGVPVNVVDRPHLSNFAVPAIVDRAPVAVAISTDGYAPVLAQRVRAAIEMILPPEFGRLGELAASLRGAVMASLGTARHRRRFWARLFEGRSADLALSGDLAGARRAALSVLGESFEANEGVVWLIGAGPGATDLLTLRAQRLLQQADVIVHDRLVPAEVVEMGRRDAERISVGKAKGHHSVPQREIDALLVRLAREGKQVARLKAGDPLVFGRAGEELAALRAAGIRHEIVPGVTSALAAAADAGVPLTLRGVSSSLAFATGHGADGTEPAGWAEVARTGGTIAVYMGVSVAGDVRRRLEREGIASATPVVAVENAGRTDRRIFSGTLGELGALSTRDDIAGPVMILVGNAVDHGAGAGEPFAAEVRCTAREKSRITHQSPVPQDV
ncbi:MULTISPECIES: siroheme synthase CysG [unclassified Chelatococcus]|uniref:siroheme synthase CysG n=1 Tax=unclassified Chelatococcus TaxID=2638111 RepID=UPI001BCEB73A|nr:MULTISPECIES: siroheme synthase CysG [unclassified Chelatococcus]MBS7696570.1 siroheme synthase CysG [Chelatococcus sp. YT9]MBX3555135.1 siroheme synthase CysG [Chelatococcus sp.]